VDAQQREICSYTANYVQAVASSLAKHVGPKVAIAQVMEHLQLVLESMYERVPHDEMAWSLIPQPHSVPMPGTAA
jgi:hypothetical protein